MGLSAVATLGMQELRKVDAPHQEGGGFCKEVLHIREDRAIVLGVEATVTGKCRELWEIRGGERRRKVRWEVDYKVLMREGPGEMAEYHPAIWKFGQRFFIFK